MNKKHTVTFQIETLDGEKITNGQYIGLEDLLVTAVLPALNLALVPLTLEVKGVK